MLLNFKDIFFCEGNILELSHRDTCGGTENWKRTYEYNTNKPNNYLQKSYTGSTPPSSPQFTYDAHGNLLEMPHLNAMSWDFQDQLKTTEKTDETTYYVYSGGERVRKVCYNTATDKIKHERIYLGGYEIYREYDASEDLELERVSNHVVDDRNRIAILEVKTLDNGTAIAPGNQVTVARYQYSNHLGSACLELNETAEIISYQEYHPFGSTSYELHTNDSEVSLKRYQYVGKERDGESGLYYYGARYYADWLCRFVSVDPLKDGYPYLTVYNYAGNKPITHYDIDGMQGTGDEEINIIEESVPYDTHTVQKGQTYWELAQTYGVSIDELRSWNNYKDREIPIGAELIVSNPNLKLSTFSITNITFEDGLKKVDTFFIQQVLENNELIAERSGEINIIFMLTPGTEDYKKAQVMGEQTKAEAIAWDAAGLTLSALAIAGGVAIIAASGGLALPLMGALFVTSGVIGAGASGASLGLHLQNTPESNKLADQLPTNTFSALTLPLDIALENENREISRGFGLFEDLASLPIRPKPNSIKKMGDLFDYGTKLRLSEFVIIPLSISSTILDINDLFQGSPSDTIIFSESKINPWQFY